MEHNIMHVTLLNSMLMPAHPAADAAAIHHHHHHVVLDKEYLSAFYA